MIQNSLLATAYNLIAIAAAAGAFVLWASTVSSRDPVDCDRGGSAKSLRHFRLNVIDNGTATQLGAHYIG